MSEQPGVVTIIESEQGILLLGPESALASLDGQTGISAKKVSPATVAWAGKVVETASAYSAQSGRWLKVDADTAAAIQRAAVTKGGLTGVLRNADGRVFKHMTFEKAALVTPAAGPAVAAIAAQAAMQAALDDITEYLEAIDAKLDLLLKQRKIEVAGQLGGLRLAFDEAMHIYDETGRVSSVTWSKIQTGSLTLQTAIAEGLAHLSGVAENIATHKGDADELAKTLKGAQDDIQFWLGVMARAIALQDRQYILELARVAEAAPDELDSHREGLSVARRERTRQLAEALDAITRSVSDSVGLTNVSKMVNPFSSKAVTRGANGVGDILDLFARHVDLELATVDPLDQTTWRHATKAAVGDAASSVSAVGLGVAKRAKGFRSAVGAAADRAIVNRAEQIQTRKGGKDADTSDEG